MLGPKIILLIVLNVVSKAISKGIVKGQTQKKYSPKKMRKRQGPMEKLWNKTE